MPRFAKAMMCTLSSFLVAACGANDTGSPNTGATSKPTQSGPTEDATGKAYDALTAGEQDRVTQVIADVDDEVAKDPTDGHATFYSAIMRFWQLGEEIDVPSNPVDELTEAQTMIDRFRKAQAMLPDDDRAPAFGGLAKVVIGNITSNTDLQAEGMSDIEKGIQIFPAYSHFLRALASAESPAGSDAFAVVLPEMQAVLDTCGAKTDASGGAVYPKGPLPTELRPCNDEGIVPHVWEGFLLNYGDLLLKAGKSADEARAMYEGAKAAPRFDEWPYASTLQDRIDDADDRAALYADSDPSNDPKIWMQDGHICTGCHQDEK
ncbi:MAG TPA: hypothetical protein VHC69_25480 [Polyangiaceae bacterium]|nr:hypothetical protein [Polyangiaceae bacterium]